MERNEYIIKLKRVFTKHKTNKGEFQVTEFYILSIDDGRFKTMKRISTKSELLKTLKEEILLR